jgi:hypothetical protein
MQLLRRITCLVGSIAAVVGLVPSPADAAPIARLQYTETALADGLFQYDYTLFNLADASSASDAGLDIWDVFLTFSDADTLVSSALPPGWSEIAGIGFFDATSQQPGASPLGTDLSPGESLTGFRLVFDAAVGSLPFTATFANPLGPEPNVGYDGTAVAAETPAPVPEPASILLLGTGLVALAERRRRIQRQRPQ